MENKHLLKILVVDDEILIAVSTKEMMLEMGFQQIKIVPQYEQAKECLENEYFDLVVLDINLGKGDEGMDLAKICFLKDISFFYVSSYSDQLTLDKAIETAPGAYVIKPFMSGNLYSAIQLTLSEKEKKGKAHFTFKDGVNHVRLVIKDIRYLKADGVYTEIHTSKKKYLYRAAITKVLELLPNQQFIQTHRSFAVNIDCILQLKSNEVVIDNCKIPISRTFKAEVVNLLQ